MRDVVLDNFKFILIALVIVGHVIEPVISKFDWVNDVYLFIYLFHMPMFAYVSGVVSSKTMDIATINSIVRKLIIPYVFLEIIYSVFDYLVFSKGSLSISPLIPYWILWYLFSLILWRLLLPVFAQFKFPIILSIIAGLACGLNSYDYNLSFSRTFVFFPFFLIGHYGHSQILEHIKKFKLSKLIGAGVIVGVFLATLVVFEQGSPNFGWLYGSRSYAWLGVEWENGVLYRSCLYAVAFLLGTAFLSITPGKRGFYTAYGEDVLYIYVLHGFVMKGLLAAGFYTYIDSGPKVIILIFASLLLLPMLSSRISKFLANNMMHPGAGFSKKGFTDLLLIDKK